MVSPGSGNRVLWVMWMGLVAAGCREEPKSSARGTVSSGRCDGWSEGPVLVDFGEVAVGEVYTETVKVLNPCADETHSGAVVGPAPPFALDAPVVLSVLPGTFLELVVSFQPAEYGLHTGQILLQADGFDDLTVDLTGSTREDVAGGGVVETGSPPSPR
jgi:hypothetical protein